MLEELTELEEGIVLAALLDGRRAQERLGRLSGGWGERCLAAWRALAGLDAGPRRARVAGLSQQLLSPLPLRLERVHPTWIAACLAREPPALAAVALRALPPAVAARLEGLRPAAPPGEAEIASVPPRLRRQICHAVLGGLASMPAASTAVRPPRAPRELATWSAERLAAALEHLGYLCLAALVLRAGLDRDDLAAQGLPCDAKLELALGAPPIDPLLPPHGAVWRATASQTPPLHLGAAALGPRLDPLLRRQLAQLLPRDQGQLLLAGQPEAAGAAATLELVRRADARARGEEQP